MCKLIPHTMRLQIQEMMFSRMSTLIEDKLGVNYLFTKPLQALILLTGLSQVTWEPHHATIITLIRVADLT